MKLTKKLLEELRATTRKPYLQPSDVLLVSPWVEPAEGESVVMLQTSRVTVVFKEPK